MDFFAQQEKARQYTKVLLLYFLIAIVFIVVAVNVVIYYFFIALESYPYTPQDWFSDGVVYYITAATCLLILSGSVYRWLKLKSGGHAVAAMVGAKRIDLHTSDTQQRQFINVVEEMSIASGVPVPGLYIMQDEAGINAFVAGYLPTEAVMVVTCGAIENFSREEMQGVVAHEYSHILNGDMQINIRLMAMLAGILMISSLGKILISGRRRSYNSRNSGGGMLALGFLLILVGSLGVFMGRMIKAAVSRQREFLADAASVQFTRNPSGIASALNTINEVSAGSKIKSSYAEDMSHMCFAQAFNAMMSNWLATHPPLTERIKRIDPSFVARIKARKFTKTIRSSGGASVAVNGVVAFASGAEPEPVSAREFSETAGKVDQSHIQFAQEIHQSFSDELMLAVHSADSAKLIVLTMILLKMNLHDGLKYLEPYLNSNDKAVILKFCSELNGLENFQRLPLFELLLPTLKQMDDVDKVEHLILCEKLIKSDKRYTLFEFTLLSMLKAHLSATSAKSVKTRFFSFKPLQKELQLLFSVMVYSGESNHKNRSKIYQQTMQQFLAGNKQTGEGLLALKEISPAKISAALKSLAQMSPLLKKSVIEASADIAMHDGSLKYTEAEFLRVIADLLACPLPPLLPRAVN